MMEDSNQKPEFYIQVLPNQGGVTPLADVEGFVKGTKEHFRRIAEIAEQANAHLIEKLNGLANKPKTFEIEFGIDVGGEAGIPFITKGTMSANFKVKLGWEIK